MKKLLLIIILFLMVSLLNATNYYIKSTGSDALAGTSDALAWSSITKVNSFSFAAGDSVLFKRGDTFYGTIIPTTSGNVSNQIVFAAYGTGAKPIITGFTTVSGWTNDGGGVYSKVITTESILNVLSFNGINQPLGRFPNTTYLTIDSHTGYTSFVDAATNSSTTDWTGAKVVIRKAHWIWDRCAVTSHSGTTINYTSPSVVDAVDGYGFFFQQDIRTLDVLGEWCYVSGKLSVYFGGNNPNTYTIKIATINRLFNLSVRSYITVYNLDLQGANSDAVYSTGTANTVKYCNISFCGDNGINGYTGTSLVVDNCNISKCNNRGVYSLAPTTITNCYIHNIAMIPGMGGDGTTTYGGISLNQSGVNNCLVEFNRVDSTGYIGIKFSGNNSIVRNNYVTNYCNILDDGGGIYTGGNNYTGRKIYNNIVINNPTVKTASYGTTGSTVEVNGIYLDDNTANTLVYNNSSSGNSTGLYFHACHEITAYDNILYNNDIGIMYAYSISYDLRRGLNITRNQSYSTLSSQYPLYDGTNVNDISISGIIDSNYYMRPSDEGTKFKTVLLGSTSYKTLAQWQTYSGQDAHSLSTPYNAEGIQFLYNASATNSTVILNWRYLTVKGVSFTNSITLLPYTSVLLFKDYSYVQLPINNSNGLSINKDGKIVKYNGKTIKY
jgi:parallel beta-helix repeat protein